MYGGGGDVYMTENICSSYSEGSFLKRKSSFLVLYPSGWLWTWGCSVSVHSRAVFLGKDIDRADVRLSDIRSRRRSLLLCQCLRVRTGI